MSPSGEGSPNPNSTAEAIKMALETMRHSIEDMQGLPPEEQLAAVEDIALHLLDEDEESQANTEALEEARKVGDEAAEREMMSRQQEKFGSFRRDIAFMCGIHLEDEELQKQEYRENFFARLEEIGPEHTDEELMEGLGFITVDDEGKKHFNFPEDIFPPYIRKQWEQYAAYVENHMRASGKHERGVSDVEDVVRWDYVRRIAHNKMAESVTDFLQLEGWDVERSRKFISKMLEQRIPNVDSSESKLTSEAVLRSFRELKAISKYRHD